MYIYINGRRKIAKRSYEMASTGKEKRGGPKLTWTEGIKGLLGEKELVKKTGMAEVTGGICTISLRLRCFRGISGRDLSRRRTGGRR